MIRQPIPRRWYWGLGVLSVLLLAGLYTWSSHRQHVENPLDKTMPSWSQLWEDGVVRVCTPDVNGDIWLWEDAYATFERLFYGLLLASLIGVALGMAMGCYSPVEAFFMPPLSFFAKIPPTAMLVVFLIAVDDAFLFAAILCFGLIPPLAQTVYGAVRDDVPDELIYKAHTLGASQAECIWDVIFKHILPKILEAIRLLIGPAMVYLIAAELKLSDVGFGYRIRKSSMLLDNSVIFFYLAVLALAGYLMDHAMIWLRRKLCPWYAE